MIVAVPKETYPEEKRVALIPQGIPALTKAGAEVVIEAPVLWWPNGLGDQPMYEATITMAPTQTSLPQTWMC